MQLKQITIIGVGLIGGSIGLAIKKKYPSLRIIGVTRHRRTLKKALRRGAIDTGTLDIEKSVLDSDMVILATPADKILDTLKKIKPHLRQRCIVIDAASVKEAITGAAERIVGKRGYFVGTHPMAGSEQRSIDRADGNLFKGTACILTRTKRTNARALKIVSGFWKAMGARIYILSPADHDRKISNISHLPHVAAAALPLTAESSSLKFAATGFKDTTRIAAGDPALWVSILSANRGNVTRDIEKYTKELRNIKNLIARKQARSLRNTLLRAKRKRDALR